MKKILLVIDSFHDGGAEMFAIRLANELCANNEVHLLEYEESKSKIKSQKTQIHKNVVVFSPENHFLLKLILAVKKISKGGARKKIDFLLSILRKKAIRSYTSQKKIDTINSHAIECNSDLLSIKAEISNLKFILSLHGHYEHYRGIYSSNQFENLIKQHIDGFDKIIYTTNDQLTTFLEFGAPPSKFEKIYYGLNYKINSDKNRQFKEGEILELILVSRAIIEKGWKEAIEAAIMLNKKNILVNLTLVGDGPALPELKSKYKEVFINFSGHTENVFPLIKRSHIGLLPTYYSAESLPNSIIEYLACGIPVIASNIGAIPEMLAHEGSLAGKLIQTQRGYPVNVAQLANLIEEFIDNPEDFEQLSDLALKAAEKFLMPTCIEKYSAIL